HTSFSRDWSSDVCSSDLGFVYSGVMRSPAWVRAVNDAKDTDALDALFAGLPPTLSVEEVSELLNISRQNTYAWLREGVIPGYKRSEDRRVGTERSSVR